MKIGKTLLAAATAATLALSALLVPGAAGATAAGSRPEHGGGKPTPTMIASGLQGASGSTIGPDGALYVTEGAIGQVTRIDLRTGEKTPFAVGLPPRFIPLGGAMDVAFIGRTAYVLVTLVGPDVSDGARNDTNGIYRIDDYDSHTVIADIGAWTVDNPPPPDIDYFVPRGLQFAMEPVRGGLLVTDGHMNRVLKVSLSGGISLVKQFGNNVPTGLDVLGSRVFLAEAGPVPHDPSTGKVVSFGLHNSRVHDVASGYSLLVDVEFGPCGLYALSQGDSPGLVDPGAPALPDSGELLTVKRNGTFSVVASGLDLPTSVDFARDKAYAVNLGGEVWRIPVPSHGHHC